MTGYLTQTRGGLARWAKGLLYDPQIRTDFFYAAFGQGVAAVCLFAGTRAITETIPPAIYGEANLCLGLQGLAIALFGRPLLLAIQRYFPEHAQQSSEESFRRAVSRLAFWWMSAAAIILFITGLAAVRFMGISWLTPLLLIALLAADYAQQHETSFWLALRNQRYFSHWQAAASLAKPIGVVGCGILLGATLPAVLLGYLAASLAMVCYTKIHRPPAAATPAGVQLQESVLSSQIKRFALPIIPIAALTWVSTLGDRYFIGALLDASKVGEYAAIYGFASIPLLILGGLLEQVFRPPYLMAIASRDSRQAADIHSTWMTTTILAGTLGVVALSLLRNPLSSLCLAEPYRGGAALLPWIAAGHLLMILCYPFDAACYACDASERVTYSRGIGALAAVVCVPLLVMHHGLTGAAAAVPGYYGAQLAVVWALSKRASTRTAAPAHPPKGIA
jgi:O-antigen/teichoic acid export membrane protein